MRMAPGCDCCGTVATCGQVCISTQDFCTNVLETGVAISVDRWAVNGLVLISGGSGYTPNGINKALSFSGGGGSDATGLYDLVGGVVGNLRLTDGGSGYTTAPTVGFSGISGGSGASATASVAASNVGTCTTSGQITAITVTNPSSNGPYGSQPNVTISGDGSGATASANRTGGAISSTFTITNVGAGYVSVPAVTISDSTGSGSGATASARVTVDTAAVNAGGTGYTAGDVLTISGGTAFTTAQLTVSTVSSGVVTAVTISRAGTYTVTPTNPVSVTGGTGTGAKFNLTWKLLQLTLGFAGSLYASPVVAIAAPPAGGTQATATATATTIRVNTITLTASGSGYTTATITVDPPASGTTATATATITAQCCAAITLGGNLKVTGTKGGRTATLNLTSVACTGSSITNAGPIKPYKLINPLYATVSGGLLTSPITFSIPFTGTQTSPVWSAGVVLVAQQNLALPSRVVQCPGHSQGAGTGEFFLISLTCSGAALSLSIAFLMNWEN